MIGRTATNINQMSQKKETQVLCEQGEYCSDVSSCMAKEPDFEPKKQLIRKEFCHESEENSFDNEQFNNVSNRKSTAKKSQIKLKDQ